jgi:4-amino-4-deoxy-L-arabinose transferase-like glycosyltransferase
MDGRESGAGWIAPRRTALWLGLLVIVLHGSFMVCRYGRLPIVPAYSEEVIINDSALSLARGQGYVEASFAGSTIGVDKVFAHFPPLYPMLVALTIRAFGVSVYSLRLTTTLMSLGSTFVLAWLLHRACSNRLLAWQSGLTVLALYCTNATLVSLEREARMESTIGLLCLLGVLCLSELFVCRGMARPVQMVMLAALAAAGCLAVHLESVTALLLLAALVLFVVRAPCWVKWTAVAVTLIAPTVLFVVMVKGQVGTAYHQFDFIFTNRYADVTVLQWLQGLPHLRHIAELNTAAFMMEIIALFLLPLAYFAVAGRRLDRAGLRYRLLTCLCCLSVFELTLMAAFLGMNRHRYQFLLGPLLALNAICFGAESWRAWMRCAAWSVVAVQLCMVVIYLVPGRHSSADTDPERFQIILAKIPARAKLAASSQLWLDLQEDHRPFSCLLPGFDGEDTWATQTSNPLERFDAIVLEDDDWKDEKDNHWRAEAGDGRQRYTYLVGTHTIQVYLRDGMKLNP